MKIKLPFLLKCSEAIHFCDKAQYREAGFAERTRLRFHFFLCKACRKYANKNNRLSQLIKKSNLKTSTSAEKEAFRKLLKAHSGPVGKKEQ